MTVLGACIIPESALIHVVTCPSVDTVEHVEDERERRVKCLDYALPQSLLDVSECVTDSFQLSARSVCDCLCNTLVFGLYLVKDQSLCLIFLICIGKSLYLSLLILSE